MSIRGNRGQQAPARENDGRFKKGHSGNPSGRKSAAREFSKEIEAAIGDGQSNVVLRRMLDIVRDSTDEKSAIAAGRVLLEYWIGKPRQQVDIAAEAGDGDGLSIGIRFLGGDAKDR